MNRRAFLRGAVISGLAGSAAPVLTASPAMAAQNLGHKQQHELPIPKHVAVNCLPSSLSTQLDHEIEGYMRAMNSPGMAYTLTSLDGDEYSVAYGYEDIDTHTALTADRLFQIGSISKSMATILTLQLVDEGKLDLHRPVMEYLPWLPWKTPLGAVTLHHVLTHTSGLPGGGALSFANHSWIHEQRYAPGKHYFYSNMCFNTLGHLVELFERRRYQESLRERLLLPLGMTKTLAAIGGAGWMLQAKSYIPAQPDRPYLRFDALREAPAFHEETSAGCVVTRPAEMAKYLRFLLRGGVTDNGKRLVSEASFAKMTTPWAPEEEFGRTSAYGYGIAVDHQDGDKILLHTGGMVSFMSSIYLNLTQGIASFASINAQQGYRPKPVTRCSVMALRAVKLGLPKPAPIKTEDDRLVAFDVAAKCVGSYEGIAGTVHITQQKVTNGLRLQLECDGKVLALEGTGERFNVEDLQLGRQPWIFLKDSQGRITGLAHGSNFYAKQGAESLPRPAEAPAQWQAYLGDYVNDDPWVGSCTIFERRGKLYMDGMPLTPRQDGTFYLEDEKHSADRIAFGAFVNGKAQMIFLNGTPSRRFHPWFQPGETV